jgi:hypothetical protein
LDIADQSLSRWVIAARKGQLDKVDAKRNIPMSALEAEVSKLRKENAVLCEECERQLHPSADTLALDTAARSAHERGRQTYGYKRLRSELIDAGFKMSLSTIKCLRHRLGLRCKHVRKYKASTDSKHNLPIAPNLLNRQFTQCTAPTQVWLTDIPYIDADEG